MEEVHADRHGRRPWTISEGSAFKALNNATKTVKKAKGDFEMKLAAKIKRDSKSFFSYARSKLRTKEEIGQWHDWKPDCWAETDGNATQRVLQFSFYNRRSDERPET